MRLSVMPMSPSASYLSRLILRLAHGWPGTAAGPALELLELARDRLGAVVDSIEPGDDSLEFRMRFPDVRLRGADQVFGIAIGGSGQIAVRIGADFWQRSNRPGRIVMILAFSETAFRCAEEKIPPRRAMIVSTVQLEHVILDSDPVAQWKILACRQIAKVHLLPFDIEHPAASNMFFGRGHELDVMAGSSSLAIAGPGRIGKTSLLQEHRRRLVNNRDPRALSTLLIDFYYCPDKSENGFARFVAMAVNPTRRSSTINAAGLVHFLQSERTRHGQPLEMLLDEVDEVVRLSAFNLLAKAARDGICRLLLAGRGVLLDTLRNKSSALECRLEALRPEPLPEGDCRRLLFEPLADLGFRIQEADAVFDHVMDMTGGLPQHLHFVGRRLFQQMIRSDGVLSGSLTEKLKHDFDLSGYLRSALMSIDPPYRRVAEALLKYRKKPLTATDIQQTVSECGIERPSLAEAAELGDRFVVQNFLAWRSGSYRIATPVLADFLDYSSTVSQADSHANSV